MGLWDIVGKTFGVMREVGSSIVSGAKKVASKVVEKGKAAAKIVREKVSDTWA